MSANQLAATIVAGLISAGVKDVVACSGSRNAPLLLGLEQAHRDQKLCLHMHLDERGAAYLALGIAKATGLVVPVVTTSGTAVGNLLPAIMEAHHSRVPILAITADRPASMRGTGANQTTIQTGIYASFVRRELAVSSREPGPWAASVARAIASAQGLESLNPGPVHLNVELAEPLLGDPKEYRQAETALVPRSAIQARPVELDWRPGTVLMVGDTSALQGKKAAMLGFQAGIPVLAEPSSNARIPGAIQTYSLLLNTRLRQQITRVIVVGRPTLSRAQRRLLCDRDLEVVQVCPYEQIDRYPATRQVVSAFKLEPAPDDDSWLTRWQDADERISRHLERLAAVEPLNGWGLTASVGAYLDAQSALVWGSSQLMRDADLAPIEENGPLVFANRGLAGIDGVTSTALGVAIGSGLPTTAVVGDLTALHDLSALVQLRKEDSVPLRLIVGNDDGGAIFSTLEQGALPPKVFERVFACPHGKNVAEIASALGVKSHRIDSRGDLEDILAAPISGLEVVDCQLQRDDRRSRIQELQAWVQRLDNS